MSDRAPAAGAGDWRPYFSLKGLDGVDSLFRDHLDASNPGRFNHRVWVSESAVLSKGQVRNNALVRGPVMLVHPTDWKWLSDPATTHPGAFGEMFPENHLCGSFQTLSNRQLGGPDALSGSWVVVWKFPADLDEVDGFVPPSCPLTVGTYPLVRDKWCIEACRLPKALQATKCRVRISPGVYVHSVDVGGFSFAMLSKRVFTADLWDTTELEKKRVNDMIVELRDTCNLCAFACFGAHHALVFHTDDGLPCTPQRLATILAGGKPQVLEVLRNHAMPDAADSLSEWAAGYVQYYCKPL